MITLADVDKARERIAERVNRTPLIASPALSERLSVRTSLKLEMLQKTGSFKPRGVFNQVLALSDDERSRGVVGFSGGNFAQAVSYVGRELDIPVRVFMPEKTPRNYIEGTRAYGAEVRLEPDIQACVEGVAASVEEGMTAVHPFDNPAMMAGNGTLGLELVEDVPDVTDVMVSIGGGGFISGVTTAVKGVAPDVRIWGVETDGADVMARSLAAGEPVEITPTSMARTLGAPYVAADAFEIVRRHVAEVVVVSDAEAFAGVEFLFDEAKVITELAAGCTVAAADRLRPHGRFPADGHLVLVLCGGNVGVSGLCQMFRAFN